MKKQLPVWQSNQPTGRVFFLDLLKAMSIVAVVSYHSIFVPQSTYADSALFVDTLFAPLRFCVPVLLTISFVLFERGLINHPTKPTWSLIKKRLVRLAIPTLFWFGLAAGLKLLKANSPTALIGGILTGEIFTGSYYLLIMFELLPLFILVRRWLDNLRNVLAVVLLQGLIYFLIHASLSGMFLPQIIPILRTINRPLLAYWFVYIALGVFFYKNLPWLVRTSARIPAQFKALSLFFTSLILLAEYHYLKLISGGAIPPFDYIMFSCILSVPVAFLCFASIEDNQLSVPYMKIVKLLSKYSLGIFCINGILREILLSLGSYLFNEATFSFPEILAIKLIGWGLLLTISLGLSVLLERVGLRDVVC
jgi:hypothetical protein